MIVLRHSEEILGAMRALDGRAVALKGTKNPSGLLTDDDGAVSKATVQCTVRRSDVCLILRRKSTIRSTSSVTYREES